MYDVTSALRLRRFRIRKDARKQFYPTASHLPGHSGWRMEGFGGCRGYGQRASAKETVSGQREVHSDQVLGQCEEAGELDPELVGKGLYMGSCRTKKAI